MPPDSGTITFLIVFTIGLIAMIKNYRKKQRQSNVPMTDGAPPGKVMVRVGGISFPVDADSISEKEQQ